MKSRGHGLVPFLPDWFFSQFYKYLRYCLKLVCIFLKLFLDETPDDFFETPEETILLPSDELASDFSLTILKYKVHAFIVKKYNSPVIVASI